MRYASAFLVALTFAWMCPCRAMSVAPPTFPNLVRHAEQIVRAQVIAVSCRWDDSAQGRLIHTYVTCRILRSLTGSQQDSVTLRLLGGQVGDARMVIPDMPTFEVGGTYILFIARNGRAFCPLVGVMHGSYRVVKDPATGSEHVARSNSEPLRTAEDVDQPMDPPSATTIVGEASGMTRESFETAILAELGHDSNQ